MKDFYLYDDVPVLRNLLNIKDENCWRKQKAILHM